MGKLYLAYGSNLNAGLMSKRCPTAEGICTGRLPNYRLTFRGLPDNAVATVEMYEGKSVPVLLWNIQKKDEKALDSYEGYPYFYKKKDLTVEIGDSSINAMSYIMTPGHVLGSPSPLYLESILQGYASAGFDKAPIHDALKFSRLNSGETLSASEIDSLNTYKLNLK